MGRHSLVLSRRRTAWGCAGLLASIPAGLLGRKAGGATATARPSLLRPGKERLKWLAFYGQSADEAVLSSYDLVVLDPMFQGDLARIGDGGGRPCAYLSLGEVRQEHSLFGRVPPDCLLEENQAWPGTWRVDVRKAAWRDFVLHGTLPAIRACGFAGLMLDTLDTPPWLEERDPVGNRGMRGAAVGLVRAIREAAPDMLVIANRGYAILPELCPMVDAVLAESLLTSPDPGGSGFRWNTPDDVALQLALLAPARAAARPIPVLSLDYWDPADAAGVREIYRRQRELGHMPYAATPLLNEITPEPDARGSP